MKRNRIFDVNSPTPLRLDALIDHAAEWDAECTAIPVEPATLDIREEGIVHRGQLFPASPDGWNRIAARVNAPAWYLEKLSPGLRANVLNEHLRRGDFGSSVKLVTRNGTFFNIIGGGLIDLGYAAVLGGLADGLGTEGETLTVAQIDRDEERLDVEFVSEVKEIDVRPGDIVRGGLHIRHSLYGNQATLIESFVYRLVCSNGMTRRECKGSTRTRKLPADHPNGWELQLNQIRRLTAQNWQSVQPQLQELRATSQRPVHVEELLARWLQRARMTGRNMMPKLLAAWRKEGAENTHYGAVNAVTSVATHDNELSPRQSRVLSSLGGLLAFSNVHICPTCFSVLRGEGSEAGESAA